MAATRTAHRRSIDPSNDVTFGYTDDMYNDVALVVDGKRVYTNSGLLAYNSPVFAELLRGCYGNDAYDVMETDRRNGIPLRSGSNQFGQTGQTIIDGSPLEVAVPNQNYNVVKNLVSFLQTKDDTSGQLTSEVVFKIFPLVVEYKMSKLKKKCGKVLKTEFESLYKETQLGKIPMPIVFKYLTAAEKYGLEKLKIMCIKECGAKVSASNRQEIVDDEHISDSVKIKILNAMCDSTSEHYENNLKALHEEIDDKFKDSDRKRNEYNSTTDQWKKDMDEMVGRESQYIKEAHEKLSDELEKKRVIDFLDKVMSNTAKKLVDEVNMLKEQVNYIVKQVEDNLQLMRGNMHQVHLNGASNAADTKATDAFVKEVTDWLELRENLKQSFETNNYNIETIGERIPLTLKYHLKTCNLHSLETVVDSHNEVRECLERASTQLQLNDKCMTEASVREKQLQLELDKTRVQLKKYMAKTHKMNTWLKWAKPAGDNDEKCRCFRHVQFRKITS